MRASGRLGEGQRERVSTGLRELDIALRIMRKDDSFWKTGRELRV